MECASKTLSSLGRLPAWKCLGAAFLFLCALGAIDYGNRLHLFVFAYATITFAFLGLYKGNEPIDVFSPALGFPVLLFMYSFASAMYTERTGLTFHGDSVSDDVLNRFYVCCIAGLIGSAAGILYARRKTGGAKGPVRDLPFNFDNRFCYRKMIVLGVVLGIALSIFIAPSFDIIDVPSYRDSVFEAKREQRQDEASGMKEIFTVELPIKIILCAATIALFRRKGWRSVPAGLLGAVLLLLYLSRNTLAGDRGAVVAALLIPVVYYHYRVRPIRFWAAALMGVLGYAFMSTVSLARSGGDPLAMLDVVTSRISEDQLEYLSLASSTELMVGTNLMRQISGVWNNETAYTYGFSIMTEMLVFIPRMFFPGRPLPMSEQFVTVFYPGVLEYGGGLGFFILQEGYWAFGTAGVFLFMFLFCACVQVIYQWFRDRMRYDLVALAYASVFFILIVSSIRSGIISHLKILLMHMIPFLLVVLLPLPPILRPARKRSTGTEGT